MDPIKSTMRPTSIMRMLTFILLIAWIPAATSTTCIPQQPSTTQSITDQACECGTGTSFSTCPIGHYCWGTTEVTGPARCRSYPFHPISKTLETPRLETILISGSQKDHLQIKWNYSHPNVTSFVVEFSPTAVFDTIMLDHNYKVSTSQNYTFNQTVHFHADETSYFVRIRATVRQGSILQSSESSPSIGGWQTYHCGGKFNEQYLSNEHPNPKEWKCHDCPDHASCLGFTTGSDSVVAQFGYAKCPGSNTYDPCIFPPACLGAFNDEFVGKYSGDPASCSTNCTETCNTAYVNGSLLCGKTGILGVYWGFVLVSHINC